MKRFLVFAVLAAVLIGLAGAARAGEKKAPPPVDERVLQQLRLVAAKCSTAVVVEVLEAGEVAQDFAPPITCPVTRLRSTGQLQRVRCKVTELIRGEDGLEEISLLVRHFDLGAASRKLRAAGKPANQDAMWAEAIFKKGDVYLLVLVVDENGDPTAGGKGPVYTTLGMPLRGPPSNALHLVRRLSKRIGEYNNPPEPTAEQVVAAEKHLAGLASRDYEVRAAASKELVEIGPAVGGLVGEQLKSTKDLEVRLRCEKILQDMKPVPGGRPDQWAGDFKIEKIEPLEEEEEEAGGEQGVDDGIKAMPGLK